MADEELQFENIYQSMEEKENKPTTNLLNNSNSMDIFWCCNIFNWVCNQSFIIQLIYMAALRADLVFSYWIYLWYVLYAFKATIYSPKFSLILGVIDNLIMFVLMLMYGTSRSSIS